MKQILALTAMLLCSIAAQDDKYTDESRPYKFAFNIEGYQHRSEEKDEKGIVKGEYGFVTGDGVYHVTVYATDENGNFKILSMKNYFIGLPTDGPSPPTPQTTPRMITTLKKIISSQGTLKTTNPTIRTTPGGIMGCGGCKIPTTTTSIPDVNRDLEFDIDVRTKDNHNVQGEEPPISNVALQSPFRDRTTSKIDRISPAQPLKPNASTPKLIAGSSTTQRMITNGVKSVKPSLTYAKPGSQPTTQKSKIAVNTGTNLSPNNMRKVLPNQILKDTKLKTKSKDSGLKIPEKSSSNILYEFNQTQSFQGQFEQGFVDNSKKGDYFVNDRDGVRRIVEYEANENGFQPHVKFEKITGSQVPIPETEKEVNELKGVYFKWFYGS